MIDPLMFIALLPAVVLVVYIYRKDRTDKEPPALLAKLLGYGALSCLPAIVVELILSAVIERLNVRNVCLGYFLEAFVVAGLTEETCKFLFLRTTWRSPAFDYQFDAIVYAVMVALGFAAFENVKYVYSVPHTFFYDKGVGDVASMLRYAGSDLSHVLIADTRNHTKHCRYIVNPPGVDAVVHQHVGVGEGDVDFDALFRTLREMKFAEQTFKVGGEPIVATSLFGYPEKMKYQAVETRELIERELLRR